MKPIWLNDWADSNQNQLEKIFGLSKNELDKFELLLASYKQDDDSAYAFILYLSDQVLYEVNASHDSELNLLGQWQPEETSVEALLFRLKRGRLGSNQAGENIFSEALLTVLKRFMQ